MAGGAWTDEDVLRESQRWVHVPRGATCLEDERRLLVHLPRRWDKSIVWRSRTTSERGANDIIEKTIAESRVAGSSRLVWHTVGSVSPPFMDERLAAYGFAKTEELEVLAFELGGDPGPRLPGLGTAVGISAGLVRDAGVLQEAHRVGSAVFLKPLPSEEEISGYAEVIEELERRRRGEPPGAGSLVLRFVACIDAERETGDGCKIIAAAGAEVVDETVRLWGAGTLERFRGRGAYRTLVVERCRVAHALGATLALTKANTGTSGPTLKRAGFRSVDTERRHVLILR